MKEEPHTEQTSSAGRQVVLVAAALTLISRVPVSLALTTFRAAAQALEFSRGAAGHQLGWHWRDHRQLDTSDG